MRSVILAIALTLGSFTPVLAQSDQSAMLQDAVEKKNWGQAISIIDRLIQEQPQRMTEFVSYRSQLNLLQMSSRKTSVGLLNPTLVVSKCLALLDNKALIPVRAIPSYYKTVMIGGGTLREMMLLEILGKNNQAESEFRAGNYSRSLQIYESTLALYQRDPTSWEGKGNIAVLRKDYSSALKFYMTLAQLYSDPSMKGNLIGSTQCVLGDFNGARTNLEAYFTQNRLDNDVTDILSLLRK